MGSLAMLSVMNAGGCTFRELDQRLGTVKGTAFRAFKRLLGELREGSDFLRLDAVADADQIAELHKLARIYPSSVNVVLLFGSACHRVELEMARNSKRGDHI